ncbi:hypothetical protein J437_LFUL019505 [Ladona fulva]|uniref:Transposase domain-containing protein n=1 Tax=Ladona fulva TaxID=123851 RepID=A0A8K0PB94_LADFU|nr:hypothetical protein J437_LFUL019505 [Ladona fulva]
MCRSLLPTDSNMFSVLYEVLKFLSVTADSVEEWIPDSEIEENFCFENLRQELRDWDVEGVTITKVNSLLKILKSHDCFSSLPADSRTLPKTPISTNIKDVGGGGKYCHFGIREKVTHIINFYPIVHEHLIIKWQTDVDGLPLSKSSHSNLWLVLIALEDHDFIPPFVAGVFHGIIKPGNVEMYMADYVQKVSKLIEDGIECMGRNYKICVTSYICDAPARAFLAQIKGHTGYLSCSKCKIKRIHSSNGVIFDKFESPLRTHEDFINKTDEQHHLPYKILPLIVIPGINMVNHFLFEYMLLVCLGVMRKIL